MIRAAATILLVVGLALGGACGDDAGEEPPATEGGGESAERPGPPGSGAAPEEEPGAAEDGEEEAPAPGGALPAIRAAIQAAIASGDPRLACGAAVTDAYLRDTYGGAAGCEAAQDPELAAERVRIGRVAIDGDAARATVRARGGAYSGEQLTARLVREADGWRLDRLRSTAPPGP